MDVLGPSHPAREIDFCKGTQLGGTEAAVNTIGYYSHLCPGSGLIVLPSKDVAAEWSRIRLQGLFESTPVLQPLVALETNRRRSRTSTAYLKRLANGGTWKLAYSSSSKILRSTPASVIIADEVDGFVHQVGTEGEPIALLGKRFANFRRGKFLRISTPTDRTGSRIERGFLDGDQRRYFLPCPRCGHYQRLIFEQLRWPQGDAATRLERTAEAAYTCLACHAAILEHHKTGMLERGIWVATRERQSLITTGFAPSELADLDPILRQMEREIHPSFHLSALYSPLGWFSWQQAGIDWERSQGEPERLKVFIMTTLGEVWIDKGEAPDWERLFARRENYEIGKIPPGVLFLTAGVDVQANRLELEIVGWGRDKQSWSIDYMVLLGDTEGDQPWRMLDEVLAREWPLTAGGALPITVMGIDSGFRAHRVYEFCARHARPAHGPAGSRIHAHRTVQATKGALAWDRLITHISTADAARHRGDLRIVEIGTGYAKQQLFDCLRLPVPSAGESVPTGFSHFPSYAADFFRGLCSESRVIRASGKPEWVRDLAVRNEPLDCRVIARAMAGLYGLDRFTEESWRQLERSIESGALGKATPPAAERETAQPRKDPFYVDDRRASSWIERRPNWLDRR
jgi:phage terminase large subunit GpA-like protein